MGSTLTIPDGATEAERRRVRQEVDRVQRNAEIRAAYPELRDEHGWERACEMLADRHPSVSKWTVREIITGRR